MSEKRAVVFCSASYDINPKYNQAAREVVRAACLSGYGIVSGGTVKGTMGHVSDEAARCGAENIGVLPRFMKGLEHPALTDLIWTDKMSERKDAMREGTCLAIALPGGIGTMDELSETFCLAQMGLASDCLQYGRLLRALQGAAGLVCQGRNARYEIAGADKLSAQY